MNTIDWDEIKLTLLMEEALKHLQNMQETSQNMQENFKNLKHCLCATVRNEKNILNFFIILLISVIIFLI